MRTATSTPTVRLVRLGGAAQSSGCLGHHKTISCVVDALRFGSSPETRHTTGLLSSSDRLDRSRPTMDPSDQNPRDESAAPSQRSSVAPSPTDVRIASAYAPITGRDDDRYSESYNSADTVRRRPDASAYGMCYLPRGTPHGSRNSPKLPCPVAWGCMFLFPCCITHRAPLGAAR